MVYFKRAEFGTGRARSRHLVSRPHRRLPRRAVLLAANLADDADTVAAVTGQLAGALYGLNAIPDHWREACLEGSTPGRARRLLSEPLADR